MDAEDYVKIGIGILIGLLIGFMSWHPSQNDYVSRMDYNKVVQENEQLKQDMANLITEFYAKEFIFDIFGIRKHQRAFCAVQKYITGEIPVLSGLIC